MATNIKMDLADFAPTKKTANKDAKALMETLAEESGFRTRHSPITKLIGDDASVQTSQAQEPKRRGRKRQTNRNVSFTVKLKLETNDLIYDLADQLDCNAIAEVLELALGALVKELDEKIDPRQRAIDQMVGRKKKPA